MSIVATPAGPRPTRNLSRATARHPRAVRRAPGDQRAAGFARRRRVAAVAILVVVALVSTVAVGRAGAQAQLADQVAGHVLLEPGQTLWDVAVTTAPDGVDPRRQLADLRELNGIDGSHVDAWSVVLVPAR